MSDFLVEVIYRQGRRRWRAHSRTPDRQHALREAAHLALWARAVRVTTEGQFVTGWRGGHNVPEVDLHDLNTEGV